MNLTEQKRVEDRIASLLATLTLGEKAILYKTLYAGGLRITDCDRIIRREPAPVANGTEKTATLPHIQWLPASKLP
jgi:hypothetical protein